MDFNPLDGPFFVALHKWGKKKRKEIRKWDNLPYLMKATLWHSSV